MHSMTIENVMRVNTQRRVAITNVDGVAINQSIDHSIADYAFMHVYTWPYYVSQRKPE